MYNVYTYNKKSARQTLYLISYAILVDGILYNVYAENIIIKILRIKKEGFYAMYILRQTV